MERDQETQIAKRAYAIWERDGCPSGRQIEHWLQAELEIARTEPAMRNRTRADRATRPSELSPSMRG